MPKDNASPYIFPFHKRDDYKGTIRFTPVVYTAPEISGANIGAAFRRENGNGVLSQLSNTATDTFVETSDEAERFGGIEFDPQNDQETIVSSAKSIPQFNTGVILYLPSSLRFDDQVSYENMELGAIGGIASAGIKSGQGAVSSLVRGAGQATSSTINLLKGGIADQAAARLAATRLAQKSAIAGGAVTNALAVTVNPNTINLFKSVALREFSFTFKLIATSQREAKEIENIIKFFRTTMYPETIDFDTDADGLNVPIGYKFPDKFDITMRYNDQPVGTKILTSVLRGFQSVYNPQSMSWHEDGKPSEVDITLSFGEERTLTRNDITAGY
jgi:hypothetical protein|tara:strand:+ start:3328 stop:4317 length:990 start_codon:yes stop_codon:yes gene_type:complete